MSEKGKTAAKKKNLPQLIAICMIVAFLLFVVACQIYITTGANGIKTEIALADSVVQSLKVDMFIVRDEKIITSNGQNIVSAVKDGTRVGYNDTVAYSFSDSESAANVTRLKEINELLDYYNGLLSKSSVIATNTESYDAKIIDAVYSYSSMASSGRFVLLEDSKNKLRDVITSKQTATGVSLDLTDTITTLRNEYIALNNKTSNYTEIRSDSTGYYISGSDGYESVLDYAAVDSWTIEDVEKALQFSPNPSASNMIGRVVHGYYWYLACIVDTDKINSLSEGSRRTISFTDSFVEDITAQIYSITSDRASGKSLIVFKCNNMSEELSSLRIENAQIILSTNSGYRIDNRAIRVNENNEKGVYVVYGPIMYFKKLYVVHSTDEYTIADDPPAYDADGNRINANNYVSLYDEYIVEGQNLYNGKIIKGRV